jgi:DNA-binding transcriptional ArsR family regulator
MQDTLSQAFAALADPTRRAMLNRLSRGEANVSDLAGPFLNQMSLPAVTNHIKVLEKAGFVTKSVNAQYRRCKLSGEAFRDVADWMEQYRVFWEESFDRLEAYLKTVSPRKKTKRINRKTNTRGKGKTNAHKKQKPE